MRLRAQLLWSFSAGALVIVVLFGSVAYQIARDAGEQREIAGEIAVLAGVAKEKAAALSQRARASGSPLALDSWAETGFTDAYRVAVVDAAGRVIVSGSGAGRGEPGEVLPLTLPLSGPSGELVLDEHRYIWAAESITGTPYRLLLLRNDEAEDPLHGILSAQFLIAGGFVIWIGIWGALIISTVISKRLDAQNAQLLYQATHDGLTDLPNRRLLYDRLQQAILYARRENKPTALLFIDLHGFKEINDTLGYHSGDALLQQVAQRLPGALRESDTVARVGGDEFAVLLPAVGEDIAVSCAHKVLEALQPPFAINRLNIHIEANIGMALFPQHGEDAETLIRHADVAVNQAKQHNEELVVYSSEADRHSVRRLNLVSELHQAIAAGELVLYYQPKVSLTSRRVVGVEALVRWQHPQRGLVPPDEFIPIAESSGLIKGLTHWVMRQAVQQCTDWRQQGILLPIAVNLSARCVHDPQIRAEAERLLRSLDSPVACLEFEITESAVMADPEGARETLQALHALGAGLAIDDFGTGFTSMAYLKTLTVKELKIGQSFVMNMQRDANDMGIVRSIIDLAHNTGRVVVAEGVEDAETLNALSNLGCDLAQGFYFARPLPPAELERWLRESPWGLGAGNVTTLIPRSSPGTGRTAS